MSKRVCILGDSITQGYNDFEKGGWADRLKIYFNKENSDHSFFNLGVSGDNTEDLLKRFKVEAEARNPEVFIVAIGINDSQYIETKSNPRIDIENFKNNLKTIKEIADNFSKNIVFIGLTKVNESKVMPIPWSITKYYDNENVQLYDQVIKDFCEENNIYFIEMFDLLEEENLSDGLHPDSEGHKKMFEKIKDFLVENKIIK